MTARPERFEVTEDDLRAWRDFFDNAESAPFRDPDPNKPGVDGWSDRVTLLGLRRVVQRDRQRAPGAAP